MYFEGLWLAIAVGAAEFQEHTRFVADDPAIMSRRDIHNIARTELDLGPVVQSRGHRSREAIPDMVFLAGFSTNYRFEVDRPSPPRFEGIP